jgi:hypothetical protein
MPAAARLAGPDEHLDELARRHEPFAFGPA